MILEKKEPHHIFLLFSIIVGILMVVMTPPMCTPDENAHFLNAYSISRGDLFPEEIDGQIGRYIPQSVMDFTSKYNGKYNGKLDLKYSFSEFYFDSWLINENNSEVFYQSTLTTINPIGYTFSAIGIAFGNFFMNIFGDNYNIPYNMLIFGRIFNLIFYISCTYQALKITPVFKRSMMILALMPMSIFLGASISYDAILIPSSFLLFATSLKLLISDDNYRITKSDIVTVLVSAFFLGGIKLAYIPFLILLLAIPIYKFGNMKKYIKLASITGVTCILAFLIPYILMRVSLNGYSIPTPQNEILQKEYVFSSLLVFPKILINTFRSYKVFYLNSFFGNLGQLDTNFPVPVIVLFYLTFIYVIVIEACNINNIKLKAKLLIIISAIISIFGIFYKMYIGWTSLDNILGVGADTVSGVQGRYFIPMFLFLCLPFANSIFNKIKINSKLNNSIDLVSKINVLICSLLTIFIIIVRYW